MCCATLNLIHFPLLSSPPLQRRVQQTCQFDCGTSRPTSASERCKVTTTMCLVLPSCLRGTSSCPRLATRPSRCGRSLQGRSLYLSSQSDVQFVGVCVCALYIGTVSRRTLGTESGFGLLKSVQMVSYSLNSHTKSLISLSLLSLTGSLLASCSNDQVGATI